MLNIEFTPVDVKESYCLLLSNDIWEEMSKMILMFIRDFPKKNLSYYKN